MRATVSFAKTATLPPPDDALTKAEITLLAGVDLSIAYWDRPVVVRLPVRYDTFAERHIAVVVRKRGAERLAARLLAHMPRKQAAMIFVTLSGTHKTTYLAKGIRARLFKARC